MTRVIAVIAALVLCAAGALLSQPAAPAADDKAVLFDVNDVSFLWPVPKTKQDVAGLVAIDEKLADGTSSILPQKAFETLLTTAQGVSVVDSAGRENKMDFAPFKEAFLKRSTWKIAGVRVDPSAPGTDPMLIAKVGSTPQLRLIVQPVTVDGATVTVHDVTAHLVFSYRKEFKTSADGLRIAIPNKEEFAAIVANLAEIKKSLKEVGVATEGKLTVHPGFNNDKAKNFPDQVKSFLKKHLREDRLEAMAFMGINPPEPWIFLAMQKNNKGAFSLAPNASIAGKAAQMLISGGTFVTPGPTTTNVDGKQGVSTALLFPNASAAAKLDKAIFADNANLKHKDIPDLIANPQRAHFFNTDCVSCHSESSRRAILNITAGQSKFAYKLPAGISGVDDKVLPGKKIWNVRNFGWFPGAPGSIATMRTGNESAASVEFINGNYLSKKN